VRRNKEMESPNNFSPSKAVSAIIVSHLVPIPVTLANLRLAWVMKEIAVTLTLPFIMHGVGCDGRYTNATT
jgi:hypothetical protein